MGEMSAPVLLEVTRGPLVECRHRGQIAVADAAGNLRLHLGDPETPVCMRSLAKPFQALPLLTTGAAAAFGFGAAELALFSGSLSGQEVHVELVKQVLARIGPGPSTHSDENSLKNHEERDPAFSVGLLYHRRPALPGRARIKRIPDSLLPLSILR